MDEILATARDLRRQIRALQDSAGAEQDGQNHACSHTEWEALRWQLHCAMQDTYVSSEQTERNQVRPVQASQHDSPTRSPLLRSRLKPMPTADVLPDSLPPTIASAGPTETLSPPTRRPKTSLYTPRQNSAAASPTRHSSTWTIDLPPPSAPKRASSLFVEPRDSPQTSPAQLSPQLARPLTAKRSPTRGDGSVSARPTTSDKSRRDASAQRPLSETFNRRSSDARQSAQASGSQHPSPPRLLRTASFRRPTLEQPLAYMRRRSLSPEKQRRRSSSSGPSSEVAGAAAAKEPKPQPLRRPAPTPLATPPESPIDLASAAKQPDSPKKGKTNPIPRFEGSRAAARADADSARIDNDTDRKISKSKPSLTDLAKLVGVQWSTNDTRSWLEKFTEVCNYFPSGIVVADIRAAGVPILWANEAFKSLIGYQSKAAVGRDSQFLASSATEMHVVQDIARRIREPNKGSKPVQVTNYTNTGKPFKYTLSLHPIWNSEGAQIFSVGVIGPTDGKCELLEEVRQSMPTLCDAQPAAQLAAQIALAAFDEKAAARMLHRCTTIFKLDLDACLSALLSLKETRAMLEAFVLDRSEPERFDLEISRVIESFQTRLYAAKEERLRAKDFEADVESEFADEAAKLCELITDEAIEPKLAIAKLNELAIVARKIICENYMYEFICTSSFEALFISRCGNITATESKAWRTALRDRLWKDYDVPADCLPWLLSLVFALEFFPRPLVICDCSRLGNTIIYANRAFCQLTEYDREEVLGRKPDFLHGPKTEIDVLKEIEEMFRNNGSDCHAVLTNYRRDRCPWQNVLSLITMKDSSGALRFCFGMLGHLPTDLGYEPNKREERLRRNCRLLSLLPSRLDDVYSEPLWEGTAAAEEAIDALAAKVNKALIVSKARRSNFVNRFKQPLTRRIPVSSIIG